MTRIITFSTLRVSIVAACATIVALDWASGHLDHNTVSKCWWLAAGALIVFGAGKKTDATR